jgi:hypothetical protein
MSEYSGVILLSGQKVSAYNKIARRIVHIPVEKFKEKNIDNKFKSFYLGKDVSGDFNVVKTKPPLFIYTLEFNCGGKEESFVCGSGSKLIVKRNQFDKKELLPIENVFNDYENIELVYVEDEMGLLKDAKTKRDYLPISDIRKEVNVKNNSGYSIIFDKDAYSVLTTLKGGIMVRGEKGG